MTDFRVPLLDEDDLIPTKYLPASSGGGGADLLDSNGHIDAGYMPLSVVQVNAVTGKISADVVPAAAYAALRNSVDFAFSGPLTVRTGVLKWLSPLTLAIRPTAVSVTLGTVATVGAFTATTFVLKAGGTPIRTITVAAGQSGYTNPSQFLSDFAVAEIPAGTGITVDITSVSNSTPSVPANALFQFWWEVA